MKAEKGGKKRTCVVKTNDKYQFSMSFPIIYTRFQAAIYRLYQSFHIGQVLNYVTTSKDTFPDVVTKQTKETESGCNFNLKKLLWTLSQFNSIITEQLPYALLVLSCFALEKSFLSKKN